MPLDFRHHIGQFPAQRNGVGGGCFRNTVQTSRLRQELAVERDARRARPVIVGVWRASSAAPRAGPSGADNCAGLGRSIVATLAAAHGGALGSAPRHVGWRRTLPPKRLSRVRMRVVEDSPSLAEVMVDGLRDQGTAADAVHDGWQPHPSSTPNTCDVVSSPRINADTRSEQPSAACGASSATRRSSRPCGRGLSHPGCAVGGVLP